LTTLLYQGERHLRHILLSYMKYYNEGPYASILGEGYAGLAHRSSGPWHSSCRPVLGGLHHQYSRI